MQLVTDDQTQVVIAGNPASLAALTPGTPVLFAGKPEAGNLRTVFVCDLATVAPSKRLAHAHAGRRDGRAAAPSTEEVRPQHKPTDTVASLCEGEDIGIGEPNVRQFQGCWGLPDQWWGTDVGLSVGDCDVLCLEVRAIRVKAGWGGRFNFPFEFSAGGSTPALPSDDLVYHVPGLVSTEISPRAPTADHLSFRGTFGITIEISFRACLVEDVIGCWDPGWYDVSPVPSTTYEADGAPPLPGETFDIPELECPSFGLGWKGISLLDVGLCYDLAFVGEAHSDWKPFPWTTADVRAVGATGDLASLNGGFDGIERQMSVTPDALSVNVVFDEFWYVPTMKAGYYITLDALFGEVDIWQSPTLWLLDAPFQAISTPFPRDPVISEADDYPQPTDVTLTLDVDPAPTLLTIVSCDTLAEGKPVQARLEEKYWADKNPTAPIEAATITFEAGGMTKTATTNAAGVAEVVFPIGEYDVVEAHFGGTEYYLPSSDTQGPTYVYRPTNFVIWGGYGVKEDVSYYFWGSQWWKQVYDATFGKANGTASFKGWAEEVGDTEWSSVPGNSVSTPTELPPYIGVVVTTEIGKHGRYISGNVASLVVLEVEDPPGYQADPGHSARGRMKAEITCTDQGAAAFAGTTAHGVARLR
jgi:hypothetical protein